MDATDCKSYYCDMNDGTGVCRLKDAATDKPLTGDDSVMYHVTARRQTPMNESVGMSPLSRSPLSRLSATMQDAYNQLSERSARKTPANTRPAVIDETLELIQKLEQIAENSPLVGVLIHETLQGMYIDMNASDSEVQQKTAQDLLQQLDAVRANW